LVDYSTCGICKVLGNAVHTKIYGILKGIAYGISEGKTYGKA
jgi:hypothetical protein